MESDDPRRAHERQLNETSKPGRYGQAPGYGYPAYGYPSYGYPSYGYRGTPDTSTQQSLRDYLLILRERIWYIAVTFLVVVSATLLYTFSLTPVYQSTATVQVFRREATVMRVEQVVESGINSAEDLNTQVNILQSGLIIQKVFDRLTPEDRSRFLAPYLKPGEPAASALSLLKANRTITPQRLSLIVAIEFRHPDREMAAKIANLMADEYIAYNAHVQVDESMKAVVELEQRANEQRKRVDEIANQLQAYREKNNLVSLDQRKDIVTEKLKELNNYVTQSSSLLQDAETRWKLVETARQGGRNLLDLSFVASVPSVSQLQQQVANLTIDVAQLSQRYRARHPKMIEAVNTLEEARRQLQLAIATSVAQVESQYQTALQNYELARAALASQEADSLSLDRFGVEYSNLARDYEVNEKLLEQILERMRETSVSGTIESPNARMVDQAVPGGRPISPNYTLNLSLGMVGGLGLGLACAFFVAYVDDRIKNIYDVEGVLGLSLLSVIPHVRNLKKLEDVKGAVGSDPVGAIREAFATLYSALRLRDESKTARCILITSTISNEGKSFITSNLASTCASHGERVVVIDCDLRRPAINRAFHLENLMGLIDICSGQAQLDDVIVRSVQPNLDIIPTGGRAKNPTQILNSREFATTLSELKKRYDRVFIDTPPIGIVSDALIVLPLVDGSIYAVYFNKTKRKVAQYCVHRLLESNVPNFGAVLDGLVGGFSGYYTSSQLYRGKKDYLASNDANNGEGRHSENANGSKLR